MDRLQSTYRCPTLAKSGVWVHSCARYHCCHIRASNSTTQAG